MRIKPIALLVLAAVASFAALAYWRAFPGHESRHHGLVITFWVVSFSLVQAVHMLGRYIWDRVKAARQPGAGLPRPAPSRE
ncbi:MAG TPA: hypothetical protein VH722_07505 [Alphaproteobacteria bacterium]|nr:hypothetical protein [Alphaproteobacteria bacterium]